jgi:allantoin racemase
LVTAGQLAKRIAIVTTLPRSIVPLEELVRRYGFADRALVTACNVAVLDLEKADSNAAEKLNAEIALALDKGAEASCWVARGWPISRSPFQQNSASRSLMALRPR